MDAERRETHSLLHAASGSGRKVGYLDPEPAFECRPDRKACGLYVGDLVHLSHSGCKALGGLVRDWQAIQGRCFAKGPPTGTMTRRDAQAGVAAYHLTECAAKMLAVSGPEGVKDGISALPPSSHSSHE